MISFEVDTKQFNNAMTTLLTAWGQMSWVTARAMTTAAIDAKKAIAAEIFPMIKGGPSPWTKRGLIVKYATKDDLTAMAGFQYGEGKWEDGPFDRKAGGVPAGRYMGVNASGGDRRAKSFELALRRAGAIHADQFVVPNEKAMPMNAQGNVPGPQYQQVLSRLGALTTTGNTTKASTRKKADYFVMRYEGGRPSRWQLGAEPAFIAKRVGRGFVPAFWITQQPNYERRFPVRQVAIKAFNESFPVAFMKGFQIELDRRS